MSSEEKYFINLSCDDNEYDEESIDTQVTGVENSILGIKPSFSHIKNVMDLIDNLFLESVTAHFLLNGDFLYIQHSRI